MGKRDDELSTWLADGYEPAFRIALLILQSRRDAEEAVQHAFLRAWRFRAAVPPGDVVSGGSVKPWLYRVVVNACRSKLRTERRHSVFGADDDLAPVGEHQRVMFAALARMPDDLRIVVALRYYGHLGDNEIASVIRCRPSTVKSRLHEARARLGVDAALVALMGGESEPEHESEIGREEAARP